MDSPLAGKRVAVLAENMYEDLELWYPLIRLREAGAQVSVVAPTAGATYKSKHGLEVKADLSAEDAKAEQFDDVVNAGGNYVDRAVVRDGDLITSRVPDDLPAFCSEIIAALSTTKTGSRDHAARPLAQTRTR